MHAKTENQMGWLYVLPVVVLVAFNAVIPLMAVVNYSVQETFGNNVFFFEGVKWFEQVLHSERFHASLLRQLAFTGIILAIEVPLGVAIALAMPRRGPWVSVCLVLMALPLLIPWNVVGAMWNIFALPDIGMLGRTLNRLGLNYNYTQQPLSAWATLIAMDVWHWTSLVVLLAYAGLSAIPDAYYQAAKIDGASSWAVFRYIQLPKMKRVLTIAVLLRFMDSFNIYTEPFVLTGGGPGNATTLAVDRPGQDRARPVRSRAGGGDVADLLPDHPAAVVDLLHRDDARRGSSNEQAQLAGADALHPVPAAADLLAGQHVVQDHQRDPRLVHAVAEPVHARELLQDLHRPDLVQRLPQLDDLRR